ncbi:MAG: hypothetical protein VX642_03360 [Bdellovibrionota bacterium]|nr:hypothetical protein [Bdellovibrionota bacterium]
MEFEAFTAVLVFSFLSACCAFLVIRNLALKRFIQQIRSKSQQSPNLESPIEGIEQKDYNSLVDKIFDSSDEFIMIFDDRHRLKLWNKSAGQLAKFTSGQSLESLMDFVSLGSKVVVKRISSQLEKNKTDEDHSFDMSWSRGQKVQHQCLALKDEATGLIKAYALMGQLASDSKEEELSASRVIESIGTPVGQLKVLNRQLGSFLQADDLNRDQLKKLEEKQGSLIDSAKGVLDFYKHIGSDIDDAEQVFGLSMNALLRSLGLLIENFNFPIQVEVEKHMQGNDNVVLLQASGFQRVLLGLLKKIIFVSNSPRANCLIKIYWELQAMEVKLSVHLSLRQLGQDLGSLWMNNILNDRKNFVDYQTKFTELSCTLEDFRKEAEVLVIDIDIPRDLSGT